jgi:hypothetical protein
MSSSTTNTNTNGTTVTADTSSPTADAETVRALTATAAASEQQGPLGTNDEHADTNIEELLRAIGSAEGLAANLETKLEEMIGELDGLLQGIGGPVVGVKTNEEDVAAEGETRNSNDGEQKDVGDEPSEEQKDP